MKSTNKKLDEGKIRKGGVNEPPTSPRPRIRPRAEPSIDGYEQVAEHLTGTSKATTDECKLYIDKMKAEMERLRVYEPQIHLVDIQNGVVDVEVKAKELVRIMSSIFGQYLDNIQAKNYAEIQGDLKLTVGFAPITVTIQRRDGKTPHECRKEVEAKLEQCKEALNLVWDELQRSDAYVTIITAKCREMLNKSLETVGKTSKMEPHLSEEEILRINEQQRKGTQR